MSATRKAAKAADERRISQIGDFKSRVGGVKELPSGLFVKIFNPGGMQVFLRNGAIPNSLMPMIKEALAKGKAPDPKDILGEDGEIDPEMFKTMGEMLDNIALQVMVEPKLHPAPNEDEERSDEKLYVDELPMEDKQYLMALVTGGVKDLESFRQQLDSGVDAVAQSQSAVRNAQRALGTDQG